MLNREEYNIAFKTNLTKEQFDEIMGNPITDLSAIYELKAVDKNTGEVWTFVPKETAIPIEWVKRYASEKSANDDCYWQCYWQYFEEDVLKMIDEWERENEHKESD